MQLERILNDLARPEAYPHPVDSIQIVQTHISVVILAGDHVWKVKKPVDLGFLDFSTLAKREYFCHEEVRLNRRLAPDVYHGVEPITEHKGQLQIGGTGPALDWAVHMRRLDSTRTLAALIEQDRLSPALLAQLARTVANFHCAPSPARPETAHGSIETIIGNARENFAQSEAQVGQTVDRTVFERLRQRTEDELTRLTPLFRQREAEGRIRDTHGDLHLEHIYHEGGDNDGRLLLIDCIEFNERFRLADPMADLAFLVMDLAYHGRRDLIPPLTRTYFDCIDDPRGCELLDFYAAYRAIVRAKVAGMKATEPEVPAQEREQACVDASAHWLLALSFLEIPQHRPCLILVGGLPGSGKSTLADGLARTGEFTILRTDQVRKDLAANAGSGTAAENLYSPEWTERTYAACADSARKLLLQGRRVMVDASFRTEANRRRFTALARELGVPVRILIAEVPPDVARERLEHRHGDISDADWSVRQLLGKQWEEPTDATSRVVDKVNLEGSPQEGLTCARAILSRVSLDEVSSCRNPGTNPNETSPPKQPT